jgi:hypothetical protein
VCLPPLGHGSDSTPASTYTATPVEVASTPLRLLHARREQRRIRIEKRCSLVTRYDDRRRAKRLFGARTPSEGDPRGSVDGRTDMD